MLMGYLADSSISQTDGAALHSLLTANGWDIGTAICVIIFMLFHWPCSTTLITVKRDGQHEVDSYRRTSADRRRAYIMFCRVSHFRAYLTENRGYLRKSLYGKVGFYAAVIREPLGIEPNSRYIGVYSALYIGAEAVADYYRLGAGEVRYLRKADIKNSLSGLLTPRSWDINMPSIYFAIPELPILRSCTFAVPFETI